MGCGGRSGHRAGSRTCMRWCISCGGGWPGWSRGQDRGGVRRGWCGQGPGTGWRWARGSWMWRGLPRLRGGGGGGGGPGGGPPGRGGVGGARGGGGGGGAGGGGAG